jgi:hypothetical protein
MDQAIGMIALCGALAAVVGISFNHACRYLRCSETERSNEAAPVKFIAKNRESLERDEREADALMKAHP